MSARNFLVPLCVPLWVPNRLTRYEIDFKNFPTRNRKPSYFQSDAPLGKKEGSWKAQSHNFAMTMTDLWGLGCNRRN